MRKLVTGTVLGTLAVLAVLTFASLSGGSGTGIISGPDLVEAAGPGPEGASPWDIVDVSPEDEMADPCTTKSGHPGHLLKNTKNDKVHCFKN